MSRCVSIAIETTCRTGGLALGIDDKVVDTIRFDASSRHATHLVARMDELASRAGLKPADINELYISAGPGSFTGSRVGVTVARAFGQAQPRCRLVAVPTALAVAQNARDLNWQNLGVVMDAKEGVVYGVLFERVGGKIIRIGQPRVAPLEELLAGWPRPLTLIGEGLEFCPSERPADVVDAPKELNMPDPHGVWLVGCEMAGQGLFTDFAQLLPIYSRKPEAVRLWENRQTDRSATK